MFGHIKKIYLILFALGLVFLSGCVDLKRDLGQPCTEEKFCEAGQDPVCGQDGITYACAALAVCEGVALDSSGEACGEPVTCPDSQCVGDCEFGQKHDANGCEICECNEAPVACPDSQCLGDCEFGLKQDADGCEICECNEAPVNTCGEDRCVPISCGTPRGQCIRESELAMIGACAPGPFQEPNPQCLCADDGCAARICEADAECGGGLCVATPNEDRTGYCINSSCEELRDLYNQQRPDQVSCTSDAECVAVSTLPSCCGFHYANEDGAAALGELNAFVAQTSCGRDWENACAAVDCALPQGQPACVEGTCQFVAD